MPGRSMQLGNLKCCRGELDRQCSAPDLALMLNVGGPFMSGWGWAGPFFFFLSVGTFTSPGTH